MKRRKIGKLYDTEKFHKAAEDAARAFVSRVMDGFADTEKGRATYERILGNLKKQIADTPTEYYKTLDAFIDGKDIFAEAEFHRSAEDLCDTYRRVRLLYAKSQMRIWLNIKFYPIICSKIYFAISFAPVGVGWQASPLQPLNQSP